MDMLKNGKILLVFLVYVRQKIRLDSLLMRELSHLPIVHLLVSQVYHV